MSRGDRRVLRSVGFLVLLATCAARPAAALSAPNQFCLGNPCVIVSPKDVDPGAVLDFGTRAVVLQSTLNLLPLPSGAIGSVTMP